MGCIEPTAEVLAAHPRRVRRVDCLVQVHQGLLDEPLRVPLHPLEALTLSTGGDPGALAHRDGARTELNVPFRGWG